MWIGEPKLEDCFIL